MDGIGPGPGPLWHLDHTTLGVLVSFVGYGLLWLVATERLAAPYPAMNLNARVIDETVPHYCDTSCLGGVAST